MNSRFVAYAQAEGVKIGEARPYLYIIWIRQQWAAWARETGHRMAADPNAFVTEADHVAFDRWLSEVRS